ncbi:MAG: diguanylate cyclase [Gammaproteobacteria bacterium]|nr:diguanylate cyclase [Gammaproteobacteria bacterium]
MAANGNRESRKDYHDPALIRVAQAEFLYRDAGITFLSSFIAALTLVPVFYTVADRARLYGWLAVFAVITLARYISVRYYLKKTRNLDNADHAIRMFMIGAFASGLAWGISGLFFVPFSTLPEQQALLYTAFYVMYCAAISSGSMAIYAAHQPVWYCFSVPCLLPLATSLAISPNIQYKIIAALIVIFFIFIARFTQKINQTIMTSLLLRLDKKDLSQYLEQERQRAYQLNKKLQTDLDERKKTEEELRRAKAEAEQLAAELLTLSSRDSLTGIANRRAFDKHLIEEWNRAIREERPISLIMADIDYYKAYNDLYGHQQGDECLRRIAGLLETLTRRGGEMAARYGGEEFAIVLAGTSLRAAGALAEQMRQAVEGLKITHEGSINRPYLTVSFGVSSVVPRMGMPASCLISTADNALYEAKADGRNKVVAKPVTHEGIGDTTAVYNTTRHFMPIDMKTEDGNPMSALEQIYLQRWDNTITVSETVLRKLIESMGYRCSRL